MRLRLTDMRPTTMATDMRRYRQTDSKSPGAGGSRCVSIAVSVQLIDLGVLWCGAGQTVGP